MARDYGIDVSNWSGGSSGNPNITLAEALAAKADGWNLAIVKASQAHTQYQLAAFRTAGMETEAYVYLYMDHVNPEASAREQVADAVVSFSGQPVRRLWLDVEDERDTVPVSPAARAAYQDRVRRFIRAASEACVGVIHSGIYTRRGWWIERTGNWNVTDLGPLWDATNDRLGDKSYIPYGGWADSAMEQYAFDLDVHGIHADANVFDPDQLALPTPAPEPEPPADPLLYTAADMAANYRRGVEDGNAQGYARGTEDAAQRMRDFADSL